MTLDLHSPSPTAAAAARRPAASASTSPLVPLYLGRGVLAIVWAVAFAMSSGSLTTGAGVLLVAYPMIDAVASLIDSRGDHEPGARTLLLSGAAVSVLAAIGLGIAATGSVSDVLHVFGTWALLAGLAQVVVAVRRRARLGVQWPMLIAGTLSALVGVFYNLAAAGDDPALDPLVAYAAAGGAFFVIQALILTWRGRRDASIDSNED